MIAITTLLLKISVSVLSLFGSIRGLLQINRFKWSKLVQLTFYISLIVYCFGFFVDNFPFEKLSLGLFQGSFIGIIVLLLLKEVDTKKNKVLWRVPLIFGLIAGFYNEMQVELGFCILELIFFIILFKAKSRYNYAYRQQFKATLMTIPMFLSFIYDDALFFVGLIVVIYMKFQILNSLKLKLKMSELNEKTKI